MSKKSILIACFTLVSMLTSVVSASAQQVPSAPGAVRSALRGMNITIGNWWSDYNTNTYRPRSDYEERQLDYRKRLLQEYNFTMQEKSIGGFGEIAQLAATSIMAGRPAATVFRLQPGWALALYGQNLLYPVSTRRVINWAGTSPIEWNRHVTTAFSFGNKSYAFMDGYGGSMNASVVFWNKRLFREAGLDPNLLYDLQKAGTWTWDKFLEISKRLTRDINNDGITDTYAMASDFSKDILEALVSSNGAMFVDRNRNSRLVNATGRPEFIEALRFYARLRDEGIMKPKPAPDAPWDWYKAEFLNANVAMQIGQQHIVNSDLRNMRDDWGMVLPPKGPKSRNYVVFSFENVMVIPARGFTDAQVDAILWAVQSWVTPVDPDWRVSQYSAYRDRRAVTETLELIRNQSLWQWQYHMHVPKLDTGHIAYEIWWNDGEPAQLIETVRQYWNASIEDANEEARGM